MTRLSRTGIGIAVFISTHLVLAALTQSQDADSNFNETSFKYRTVKTKEGLIFRVPEDMPIETRGGIQAPIPFDEYIYRKFKQTETRLQSLERKIDRIEAKLSDPDQNKTKPVTKNLIISSDSP